MDFAMSEGWHRPYAMALIEKDPAKQMFWIGEAERAIIGRYLELRSASGLEIEFHDLRNATDELQRLKAVWRANQREKSSRQANHADALRTGLPKKRAQNRANMDSRPQE